MMAALLLSGYALIVAWSASVLLTPLTSRGISARLGLTAWLTAMASVLACLVTALAFLVTAAVASWPGLAEDMCRSVAGGACTPLVYRSVFEFGLSVAGIAAAATSAVLACRYGRHLQRARQGTRAHAEVARVTGRRLPGLPGVPGVPAGRAVVLDSPQRVAYCVPGRPAAIVLSTGALAVLDPSQLTAVLAHERAHLAGRHHLLITATRGLAATFPAVPLFTRGPAEVARLAEMCADDAAVRSSGRYTLVAALLAMGTGTAVPAAGLAASTCAVEARVQRLLEPARRARRARYSLALAGVTLLLTLVSALIAVLA
jgi:Zn-dependent protease with chaperone function